MDFFLGCFVNDEISQAFKNIYCSLNFRHYFESLLRVSDSMRHDVSRNEKQFETNKQILSQ